MSRVKRTATITTINAKENDPELTFDMSKFDVERTSEGLLVSELDPRGHLALSPYRLFTPWHMIKSITYRTTSE